MKRVICLILAVLMMAVLFAGCKVKTTVAPEYVDDFVNNYATPEIDEDGAVTYEFESKKKYEEFLFDYHEAIEEDANVKIESVGQYSYYNPEVTEVIVGITPESYEELGEEAVKAEAQEVGKEALRFQMNTKNPKGELTVTYRNANTSEEYFTITVKAE